MWIITCQLMISPQVMINKPKNIIKCINNRLLCVVANQNIKYFLFELFTKKILKNYYKNYKQ